MLKLRPVALAALCVLSSAVVFGQAVNGRIDGSTKDTAGAVVPGAKLVISNIATGITRTAQGSNDGAFSFAEVAPGTYTLVVEAQGFKKVLVPQLIVEVGTTASVNITLEVGTVSEEVTVTASEAQQIVNTANAQIGDVVDRRRILDLPLDGRNPLDLATLQGGFDDTGRVNGERARALNVTVNGINASDNFNKSERSLLTGPAIPVTVESVGEFQVTTELATAEYGRGGAQVNAITASGTNRFRGSLFYFHRNTALNANNFFNNRDGLPRNILLRNQFGGRCGHPGSFISEKEERAAATIVVRQDHRPAEASAKLIAQENVARQAIAIVEKVVRIQRRVAVKVKQRAAELVCSGSSDRIYLCATPTIFGRGQFGRYL